MIAVCLLTCDRPELSEIAARSTVMHNRGRHDLAWLHCDGESVTSQNDELAQRWGFETLEPSTRGRSGQMVALRAFVARAVSIGAEWIAWLENDWESVAPLPSSEFLDESGVETIRLFGTYKMRAGSRTLAGARRMGTTDPIRWNLCGVPGWESACAHWGAGGTLVRTEILARHQHLPRLKDIIYTENNLFSLRPLVNLWWCNGLVSTPGLQR